MSKSLSMREYNQPMIPNLMAPSQVSRNARWNEQVHFARHEFQMQCIGNRIDLMVVETMFEGIAEIAQLRVTKAVLPILHGMGRIERLYGSLGL